MTVIEAKALTKRFGRTLALQGVDLQVAAGDVHGFLGPNGAGKSTTIRVLLGLLKATSGTATVFGKDAWRDATEIHKRIAYVPGDVTLWPNLTGGEAIDIVTAMRGHKAPAKHRARLIEAFDLDPRRKSRTYSKGNRQKVSLVAAFASQAELYIFDEPTSGLDPLMEEVFRDEVRRVVDDGATVLLSSHILSEVEQLCQRVSIIRQGAIVESGTLQELRHLSRTIVRWVGDVPRAEWIEDLQVQGENVSGTVADADMQRFLAWASGRRVQSLTMQPPSLEQLFLSHYDRVEPAAQS